MRAAKATTRPRPYLPEAGRWIEAGPLDVPTPDVPMPMARCPDGPDGLMSSMARLLVRAALRWLSSASETRQCDCGKRVGGGPGEWAIPEAILASAPEPPWGFPVEVFVDHARRAFDEGWTPTHHRVAEALPAWGDLLDVGCGAGAASLRWRRRRPIVAVDEDATLLDALATLAGVGCRWSWCGPLARGR